MPRYRTDVKSIVLGLIIANIVIFFFTAMVDIPVPQGLLNNLAGKGKITLLYALQRYGLFITLFSLFPVLIKEMFWIWQVFTYMFLHGGPFHLLFNMYALFLFGKPLEERWGWREFLFFYLSTGVGAGIVTFLWNIWRNPLIPTVGASGALFGLVLAFGMEFPEAVLLLFFVLPVRAKYAALIFGGIELIMILTGSMQRIGHFTHIAGLGFGYLYYLLRIKNRYRPKRSRFSTRLKQALVKTTNGILDRRRERLIETTLSIKEKLNRGETLSSTEERFLEKLREEYRNHESELCEEDEFSISAYDCKNCDSFYACLFRFIMR